MADRGGYCTKHYRADRQQRDKKRKTATQRGYDNRWHKARNAYLLKHPLCVRHEEQGIIKPANVVDHIIPHNGDMVLFWDTSNWQSLCKECHDTKTATEDGGFGNVRQ